MSWEILRVVFCIKIVNQSCNHYESVLLSLQDTKDKREMTVDKYQKKKWNRKAAVSIFIYNCTRIFIYTLEI